MDLHASGSHITFFFKSIAESVSEGSHLIVRSQHEESKIPIVSVERNPIGVRYPPPLSNRGKARI